MNDYKRQKLAQFIKNTLLSNHPESWFEQTLLRHWIVSGYTQSEIIEFMNDLEGYCLELKKTNQIDHGTAQILGREGAKLGRVVQNYLKGRRETKRKECSKCRSSGMEKCYRCSGRGAYEKDVYINYRFARVDLVKCDYCLGKGEIKCEYCKGTGISPYQ